MTNQDLIEIIKMEGTATRALMRSEIDRIEEMDRVRNGRICEAENSIKEIKSETKFFRWMHNNPKWSLILMALFVAAVVIGTHTINIRRTIERMTKIELNDN